LWRRRDKAKALFFLCVGLTRFFPEDQKSNWQSHLPGSAAWEIHPVMKIEFSDQYRAYQQRTPLAITAVYLLAREMR
jgi:hypothetical protein